MPNPLADARGYNPVPSGRGLWGNLWHDVIVSKLLKYGLWVSFLGFAGICLAAGGVCGPTTENGVYLFYAGTGAFGRGRSHVFERRHQGDRHQGTRSAAGALRSAARSYLKRNAVPAPNG